MASDVQICNMALARIGQKSISSLTEASTAARFCAALFEYARDAVMEDYPWNFATARLALADLGDPPDDWSYRYAWPSGCLRAVEILPAVKGDTAPSYKVENYNDVRCILTDKADAVLIYVKQVTDPNLFSQLFIQALSYRLGAELADPLTGDLQRQQKCETMYQNVIRSAWASDADQGQPDAVPDAAWIEARLG